VAGLTAGACWLLTHPLWLIRSADQVVVEGNQLLGDEVIQTLLPLDYPQSVLAVNPHAIADQLLAQAPIAEASVIRHLLPPRLEIWVQERQPVAVTRPVATLNQPAGLMDAKGNWLPQDRFTAVDPDWPLPPLVLQGYSADYAFQWPEFYAILQASPVTVTAVDWRDPGNVILDTELGTVHGGAYTAQRLRQQLTTLAQLRSLLTSDQAPQVTYIDLSDPEAPVLQGATLPATGSAAVAPSEEP
jgi:cell division protein FtsQ